MFITYFFFQTAITINVRADLKMYRVKVTLFKVLVSELTFVSGFH